MTSVALSFSVFFFFQAEDGIRDLVRSRGLGDVYKRQAPPTATALALTLSPTTDEQSAGRDAGDPTRIWLVGLAAAVLLGGGLLARRLARR